MAGGIGDDIYVTDGGDTLTEDASQGTDEVRSSVDFTLGLNFEALTLTGTAVSGTGNAAANTITGNDANNTLFGLAGGDTLSGGIGNDILTGGLGRDLLTGGAGKDVFDFNLLAETGKTKTSRDAILDFTVKTDDIDLRTLDASTKLGGNQAFKFIGTQAFHKVAGELRYEKSDVAGTAKDKTIVYGDTNGDGKHDFMIELVGLKTLTAGDFLL